MRNQKFFALIPAAGHSRRMGKHKLLLPWQNTTVIDSVLSVWKHSDVQEVLIVVRSDDVDLLAVCEGHDIRICRLDDDTDDMKETVQHGLRYLERKFSPDDLDCCLIAPADLPRLTVEVVNAIIESAKSTSKIVAPWYGDKKGHPICFPWTAAAKIFQLASDQGLNALVTEDATNRVDMPLGLRPRDIDTPEDYRRELGK